MFDLFHSYTEKYSNFLVKKETNSMYIEFLGIFG